MKRRGFALGAVLAASCLFGVAPGFATSAVAGQSATTSQPEGSPAWHVARVEAGDTLEAILTAAGATSVDAGLVGKAMRTIFDPRDLQPGQQIAIRFEATPEGARTVGAASLDLAKGHFVQVTRSEAGGFAARRATQPLALPSASQATPAPARPSADQVKPVASVTSAKAMSAPVGRTFQIKKGDTLASLLQAARIDGIDGNRALKALGSQVNVGALSIGQDVIIARGSRTKSGHELTRLAIVMKDGRLAEVIRREDGSFAAPSAATSSPRVVEAKSERTTTSAPVVAAPAPLKNPVRGDLDIANGEAKATAPMVAAPAPPKNPARADIDIAKKEPKAAERMAAAPTKESAPANRGRAKEEVVTLSKGGTLHSLLKGRGYSLDDIVAVAKATALSIDPTALRWGQRIRVAFHAEAGGKKRLDGLAIERKDQPPLLIARGADGVFGPRSTGGDYTMSVEPATEVASAEQATSVEATDFANGDGAAVYIEEQAAQRDAAFRVLVQPGDSLMNMLLREGIDANEIDQAVRSLRKIYNPRRLREGQFVALLTDIDPSGGLHLSALSLALNDQRYVEVRRSGENFTSGFGRAPSFADRLPPEGTEVLLYASYPALPQVDLAQAAMNLNGWSRAAASEDGEGPEGWSVLSWLGSVGDLISHTSSAEAAIIDMAPEPAPNRALDLEERAGPPAESQNVQKVKIAKGDTLVSALVKAGVGAAEAEAVAATLKKVYSPRHLREGQTVALAFDAIQMPSDRAKERDTSRALRRVSLSISPDRDVVVERGGDNQFDAHEVERPLVRSVYKATGKISSSFYVSALEAGLSIDVLTQLVQLFSYDVDFQRDLQPGDRFEVLFERIENDRGEMVEQGTVLYAALTLSGEGLAFYRYEPPDGLADYFDRAGNSVRKALLRTPIDGARISSGFGMRKHPVLGYSKQHKGVDFSAPPGTPIYAAGDGVIEKIGTFSSYGKYIRVRHNDTFKTAYAHMKGYGRGLKTGTKVRQGQVIGFVGTTGRSTGSHLHYEVIKQDVQVNPNRTKLPTGSKLTGKQFARFKTEIEGFKMMFAQAGNLNTRVARNTRNRDQ